MLADVDNRLNDSWLCPHSQPLEGTLKKTQQPNDYPSPTNERLGPDKAEVLFSR